MRCVCLYKWCVSCLVFLVEIGILFWGQTHSSLKRSINLDWKCMVVAFLFIYLECFSDFYNNIVSLRSSAFLGLCQCA